ncbi:MAG: alanine--tRNA ligase [Planctomycetota bacterium]|nr:alanine--tRNA ligase [Planctomycetota bacterium]
MQRTCRQIRDEFIDFFKSHGHTFVPSSSLLPAEDPTLLFTNAGMNQFKEIFLGQATREYVRAANTQKCIRAGGKHNDLEDVGHDTYHHTFFEMLGNWSFGDYFKREAIAWAWELLTKVWGLPKDRLHATVFAGDPREKLEGDDEAAGLWREVTDIDPAHIHRGNKKDNFWEMGETGPCGPCSEIHIDLTPDKSGGSLVNAGDARVMEIWNLVFIQYNRGSDGKLSPLPARHVDTGMGLERVGMVLQGKRSNYATDLFVPIIQAIEALSNHRYGAKSAAQGADRYDAIDLHDMGDIACRVIADHARTLAFAIADGILPSNDGRGYVVRRILRRAVRYGRQHLGIEGAFLVKLVPVVVALMGDFFPELRGRKDYVVETIAEEESSFGRTLDRGIALFERQGQSLLAAGKKTLDGEVAFDLYATYGFPVDLTQLMAAEIGLSVDMAGYEKAMDAHKETSGAGEKFKAAEALNLPATDDGAKYAGEAIGAKVLGWVAGGAFVSRGQLAAGADAAVVLDRTSFYAEQGGQVGDSGQLIWPGGVFHVKDTQLAGAGIVHVGRIEAGTLAVGQAVTCKVGPQRMDTRRHHTATHLLNWALREVLGEHVNQAGSVVSPDRLRFDFSHNKALTGEQAERVEQLVNERVLNDEPVTATVMPLAKAKEIPGVRAMFGEKYPDPVRVVAVGSKDAFAASSAEFCGGTHLERTSQVGFFKILSEESVAKGVRRITAVTGHAAAEHVRQLSAALKAACAAVNASSAELPERIAAMQKEIKELRKKPAGGVAGVAGAGQLEQVAQTPHGPVLVGQAPSDDPKDMRGLCDQQRQKGAAAVFVGAAGEDKVTLIAMVCDALAAEGKVKAGDWVKAASALVEGSGGGKPTMAQAGGKRPEKLPEALAAAGEWVKRALA